MERRRSPVAGRAMMAAVLIAAAWGGLAAQDRRLLDANGYVRDDAYPRPLVPAADQKYLKIDGLKMKDTLKEVVAISYKSRDDGNKYWGRIAGTKYRGDDARLGRSPVQEGTVCRTCTGSRSRSRYSGSRMIGTTPSPPAANLTRSSRSTPR